jgi:hypothetical protein
MSATSHRARARRRFGNCQLLLRVIAIVAVIGLAGVAGAAYQFTPPSDLAPGAAYQLLFTTDGLTNATHDFGYYQSFVTSAAAANALLPETDWHPVAFIHSNPGYYPSSVATDAPLYNLLGQRLLDHASDLFSTSYAYYWNGSQYVFPGVPFANNLTSSSGNYLTSWTSIWTGTDRPDYSGASFTLGNPIVFTYGGPWANHANYDPGTKEFYWKHDAYNYSYQDPMFCMLAMSDVMVPEPVTLIVWSLLGGLGVSIGWWRWRRNSG